MSQIALAMPRRRIPIPPGDKAQRVPAISPRTGSSSAAHKAEQARRKALTQPVPAWARSRPPLPAKTAAGRRPAVAIQIPATGMQSDLTSTTAHPEDGTASPPVSPRTVGKAPPSAHAADGAQLTRSIEATRLLEVARQYVPSKTRFSVTYSSALKAAEAT